MRILFLDEFVICVCITSHRVLEIYSLSKLLPTMLSVEERMFYSLILFLWKLNVLVSCCNDQQHESTDHVLCHLMYVSLVYIYIAVECLRSPQVPFYSCRTNTILGFTSFSSLYAVWHHW